jgi:hypothetical protein
MMPQDGCFLFMFAPLRGVPAVGTVAVAAFTQHQDLGAELTSCLLHRPISGWHDRHRR